MRITRIFVGIAAILLMATSGFSQERRPVPRAELGKYVVSAKAGVVNIVEGDVQVIRARLAAPESLISGDELQAGDTVKTGPGGRAEILLNPGSYLRLGANSEFIFLFDTLSNDKLKLLRGSAVLEASALEASLLVDTPKTSFVIARDGVYRFDVSPDGKTEVAVRKGRVLAGRTTIKAGKRAAVEGDTAAIAKLNKQDSDALDDWSKTRANTLIALNSGLSNVGMSRTLGMSMLRNAWIYDPFCRCYTFLPLGGGFASPYGGSYAVCNPYGYYYSRPRYNNGGWTGGGSGGGGSQSGGSGGGGSSSGGGGGGGSRGGGAVGGGHQPPSPPSMTSGSGPTSRGADRGERAGPRRP
jgi:hypothetical protein